MEVELSLPLFATVPQGCLEATAGESMFAAYRFDIKCHTLVGVKTEYLISFCRVVYAVNYIGGESLRWCIPHIVPYGTGCGWQVRCLDSSTCDNEVAK